MGELLNRKVSGSEGNCLAAIRLPMAWCHPRIMKSQLINWERKDIRLSNYRQGVERTQTSPTRRDSQPITM
jgi:hypothetical protein